jgi:hypothetical protein
MKIRLWLEFFNLRLSYFCKYNIGCATSLAVGDTVQMCQSQSHRIAELCIRKHRLDYCKAQGELLLVLLLW